MADSRTERLGVLSDLAV